MGPWQDAWVTSLVFHPGITQLRFKPAYNPYTEPSMEVFSYHQGGTWYWGKEGDIRLSSLSLGPLTAKPTPHLPSSLLSPISLTQATPFFCPTGLKKWVEVGNSGLFRPEMLLPMGLPENVSVIAWGLSLER